MRKPLLWPTLCTLGLVYTSWLANPAHARNSKQTKPKSTQHKKTNQADSASSYDTTVAKILPLPLDQSSWLASFVKRPNFDTSLFPDNLVLDAAPAPEHPLIPLALTITAAVKQAAALTQEHYLVPGSWIKELPMNSWAKELGPRLITLKPATTAAID